MYPVIYVVGRHWLRVVHEDYVPLAVHFDRDETRAFGGKRNVRESLQQRQHAAFHDRSNCRTYLSPDVQLPTRCSCEVHQAANIQHHQQGSREGDTNHRAVGQLIDIAGGLETAARRPCAG